MAETGETTWVTEIREGLGGWSAFLGIFFSVASVFSFVAEAMQLSPSAVFSSFLDTYRNLIKEPIIHSLSFLGLDLNAVVVDLAIVWLAVGGMVFRTATTISRQVAVLGTETGHMIWLERVVNGLKIGTSFLLLRTSVEHSRKASVTKFDETIDDQIVIRQGTGCWSNIYIDESKMNKSFVGDAVKILIGFFSSVALLIVLWPISLVSIVRSPKLCHEFSGAKVLFGGKFKHGEKFDLIADLRRVFAFQFLVFLFFVITFLVLNTPLQDAVV